MPWYKIQKPEELNNLVLHGRMLRYHGYPHYTYCNAAWFANMSFNITYRRIIEGRVEYRVKPKIKFTNGFSLTKTCNFYTTDFESDYENIDILVFNPMFDFQYTQCKDFYKLLVLKYRCVFLNNMKKTLEFDADIEELNIPIFKTKQELIKYLNKE
jgi:hypothetical protein